MDEHVLVIIHLAYSCLQGQLKYKTLEACGICENQTQPILIYHHLHIINTFNVDHVYHL